MPLILVIAAEPHEAAQLAKLIQGRLSVDLVQAPGVGEGLLALEDRIPDLILTSPLMSPFDDGVLDEYLRDLGPAGAHVQTLRIPVLSQAPKKTRRLSFSLRRSKPETPVINGCEPKVFADEIEQYLARAAEEKQHTASNDQPVVVERQPAAAVAEPAIAEEQWTAAYGDDEPVVNAAWSAPEPEPEVEPATEPEAEPVAWRADLLDRPLVEETPIYLPGPVAYEETPIYQPTQVAYEESPVETVSSVKPENAVEVEAASTWQKEEVEDVSASEPVVVEEPAAPIEASPEIETVAAIEEIAVEKTPIEAAPIEAPAIEKPPVAVALRRPAAPQVNEDKATPSFKAALAAIRAAWGKPPRTTESPVSAPTPPPPVEPEPVIAEPEASASFEVDLSDVVEVVGEEPSDVHVQAALTQHSPAEPVVENDVYELSVEPDLSEIEARVIAPILSRRERSAAKPAPVAPVVEEGAAAESESAPAAGADANGARKKGKRAAKGAKAPAPRQAKAQPQAQDEWGIFDPNQCGFAALVDKLDEVADKKTKQRQNGSKTRVISFS
jgi:hypothetical protein